MIGHAITPENVAFARNLARQTIKRLGLYMDVEDAEGIAMVALCESARRWRPNGGASFKAFSYTRIRGAIIDAHRSTPGNSRFPARRGRHVSLDEIQVGVPARQEDSAQLLEAMEAIQVMGGNAGALLRRRLEGETLSQASAALGLSKSWACRLEAAAIAKLEGADVS